MIRTEELYIDNTDEKATAAIAVADEFIKSLVLDKKQAMHIRLLAEETIGMVRAMTVNFEAYFWLEKENDEYRVKLNVRTDMSKEKKEELLSLSTSGENVAVKGFMGKIREMIENSLLDFDSALSSAETAAILMSAWEHWKMILRSYGLLTVIKSLCRMKVTVIRKKKASGMSSKDP